MEDATKSYSILLLSDRGKWSLGGLIAAVIFFLLIALQTWVSHRHLFSMYAFVLCLIVLVNLLWQAGAQERISATPRKLILERLWFGRVMRRRELSTRYIGPLAYEKWQLLVRGIRSTQTGVRFKVDGRLVECALGTSALQGWEIVDGICEVTGLQSTENETA